MTKKQIKKKEGIKIHQNKNTLKTNLQKRFSRRTLTKYILTAIIILAIVLIFLVSFSFGLFEPTKKERLFQEQDACSLVMGNLIHQIRDVGDCQIRCRNDCEIRKMEFVRSEFFSQEGSCHDCNCYCK